MIDGRLTVTVSIWKFDSWEHRYCEGVTSRSEVVALSAADRASMDRSWLLWKDLLYLSGTAALSATAAMSAATTKSA